MNDSIALDLPVNADESAILSAISEGMNDMIESADSALDLPSKKKAKKPAKEAKPKAPNAEKAAKEAAAKAKPAPVIFKAASGASYELAKDANPAELKKDVAELSKALSAIDKKDSDLLGHYLSLGKFQSKAAKLFKSSKLYGQFLASELPASQKLDAALRSNCKWLWEALNVIGADGSDLLSVLNVNRIEDYKSKNPTVIKRDYKQAKAELERMEAAEELGVSLEELEEQEKAEAEAAKAEVEALIKEFVAEVAKPDQAEALLNVLKEAFIGKKKDAVAAMKSYLPPAH